MKTAMLFFWLFLLLIFIYYAIKSISDDFESNKKEKIRAEQRKKINENTIKWITESIKIKMEIEKYEKEKNKEFNCNFNSVECLRSSGCKYPNCNIFETQYTSQYYIN